MSLLCLAFYAIKSKTALGNFDFINSISWSLLSVPILVVSAFVLGRIKWRSLESALGFLGKHSLEMYLWNIFLIQAIEYFDIKGWLSARGDAFGFATYTIVVIGGVALSIVYGVISKVILDRIHV